MDWLRSLDLPARRKGRPARLVTSILIGMALAAAAVLARAALQQIWSTPVPFGFMFPAILLATLLGRWPAGLTTYLAGALIAWFLVLPDLGVYGLGADDRAAILIVYLLVGGLMLIMAEAFRTAERRVHRERTLRAEAEAKRQRLLSRELNHRIKNILATVQAIASQTLARDGVDEAARQAFEARIAALGRAQDLLTRSAEDGASLHELAAEALSPFDDGDRFRIDGPAVRLPSGHAVSLSLALHELATNALKHGALSVPQGRVELVWALEGGELSLGWAEFGGPAVRAPESRGFGTRLLERGLAAELRGAVQLEFAEQGLRCSIRAPLAAAEDGRDG